MFPIHGLGHNPSIHPPVQWFADLPWLAPSVKPQAQAALQMAHQTVHQAALIAPMPWAPLPPTNHVATAGKSALTVNNVWRQTNNGPSREWTSVRGPNHDINGKYLGPGEQPPPRWEKAFIAAPMGPMDFAKGYVTQQVDSTLEMLKTVTQHTANTAVDMAKHGQLTPWSATPDTVLYQASAVLSEAWVKPLAKLAKEAIAHPDQTVNAAGDNAADFLNQYVANLTQAYHTNASSAAAGAATYLLLSHGLQDLLGRIRTAVVKDRQLIQSLATRDLTAELADTINRGTQAKRRATADDISSGTVIQQMPANNGALYVYAPHVKGRGDEKLFPEHTHVSGFNQYGYSAFYEPHTKTLAVDINAKYEGMPHLQHAWGDGALMMDTLLNMLRVDRRPVEQIHLRAGELQIPPGQRLASDMRSRIESNEAVQALKAAGYRIDHPDVSTVDDVVLWLKKNP